MANISIAQPRSLKDLLAETLPKDVPFTFYHYSTPPIKSTAVFNAPPHRKPERTYCESHLLAVTIAPRDNATTGTGDELLVLAIEVLVYTTKALTTIFVSKADSTGYLSTLNLPRSQSGSPLKSICGTFVSWLARERHREGKKVVVSLFARAQDQYLFPASIENKEKHVLDDRGLVKWWCKVLDPIVREYAVEEERQGLTERLEGSKDKAGTNGTRQWSAERTAKGYLVIPGFDPYDTLRYIPPSPTPSLPRRWAATHPLLQIAPHPNAPPRCLVPHFPDDPKSRFLDELDSELPDSRTDDMSQQGGTPSRSNGQWKSVKTLDQFWEMMAFRQECSSGRIVGFIWVVIKSPDDVIAEEDEDVEPASTQSQSQNESQQSIVLSTSPFKKRDSAKKPRRRKVNTTSGPIPLILPRIKSSTSNLSTASSGSNIAASKIPPESTPYYAWPTSSRGTIILSSTAYDRAHEILLQQNFATRTATARSTKRWKDEVAVLGGVQDWGWRVVGRKKAPQTTVAQTNGAAPTMLMGVRKKRKPEEIPKSDPALKPPSIHTLDQGLVRKKAKLEQGPPATDAGAEVGAADGVNTLGAGLVRKKPKN
jgi:regulator of Ty1 transposition protein 109